MENSTWQDLVSLESRDAVTTWFKKIHDRDLNEKRAKEIISAAKQAREFYKNASRSDYSVKALLSYYGTSSLARSLTLLLMPDTGEASLQSGHGLTSSNWRTTLSGDLSSAISKIGELEITTCDGSFTDFMKYSKNTTDIHLISAAVDVSYKYPIPSKGTKIKFVELIQRIPDLIENTDIEKKCWRADLGSEGGRNYLHLYGENVTEALNLATEDGYEVVEKNIIITSELEDTKPIYLDNKYQLTAFSKIPEPYITLPFYSGEKFSQLSKIYMASYFIGMLCRYHPTHWVALMNGQKGDALWPVIHRLHSVITETFPLLVLQRIQKATNS